MSTPVTATPVNNASSRFDIIGEGGGTRTERYVFAFFLLIALFKASAYWIGSAILLPDEPLSTIVLFRGKDIESFPIMKNLALGGLGEPGLYEGHNAGILTERFIPWVPHALLFGLAGPAGFIIADLILTALRFILVVHLLRWCGIGRAMAAAVGAVLTCYAIDNFGEVLPELMGEPVRFWGLRIPRPFVSEMFLLLALIAAIAAFNGIRARGWAPRWAWATAGTGLALLGQSDFYSAIGMGLGLLGVFSAQFIGRPSTERIALLRGGLTTTVFGLVFSVPGILQSAFTNPESLIRLGLFPVSRLNPPVLDVVSWYLLIPVFAVINWLLSRSVSEPDPDRKSRKASARIVLLAICIGALVAMPFTSIVTGKAIELYHFRDSFMRYLSLMFVVYAMHLWVFASRFIARRILPDTASRSTVVERALSDWAIIVPATILCFALIWQFATVNPRNTQHMRAEFQEWGELENYRQPFVELVRELSTPRYNDYRVLGTFDHQVWSWWVTFRDGYSYLADACTTNVAAEELERRSSELAKLIGMSPEEYVTFIRRRYVMIFWMSCSKYQGTRAYSFSPLSDYTEADRSRIQATPRFLNFTVALPLSQQERLVELFETLDPVPRNRLDMVILTKDRSVRDFAPPDTEFELTFENSLFRVWVRRARVIVGGDSKVP